MSGEQGKASPPGGVTPDADLQARGEALLERVRSYHPEADLDKLRRGFELGERAHDGQRRKSGEPYYTHSLSVAEILASLRMDIDTIIAGLLHDVVEDTEYSIEELREEFGDDVALLVDGVTKIEEIRYENPEAQQAENYRKLLLTLAKDVRVILIKLADRLHNMRTLDALKEHRRLAIAEETLNVYAPLAHRFGIARIKSELEDLAFKHLHPEEYRELVAGINARRDQRQATIDDFLGPLRDSLADAGIKAEVSGRPKHFYSIYKKMQARETSLDKIYDLLAVRVIVEDVGECYHALGVVHSHFQPLHERLKDYIANPKQNMYQSLHTTVRTPRGELFEVQIRTGEMHRRSELGVAAHWRYKEGEGARADARFEEALQWFREVLEMQQDVEDPREFMDSLKIDLFQDEVYVFTPRGDLVKLPQGATALDFAYYVHSQVGMHCTGARVDGRMVPLRYQLHSGETVEVITQKNAHPSSDWLEIVQTSRAKHRIRQWLKHSQFEEAVKLGREMLERELGKRKAKLEDLEERLLDASQALGHNDVDRLLAAMGNGDVPLQKVANKVAPVETKRRRIPLPDRLSRALRGRNNQGAVRIQGIDSLLVRFARCCQPVPGDRIKGVVTVGRGVSVHRADCRNIREGAVAAERLLDVAWDVGEETTFPVQLTVTGRDRQNLLADISRAISDLGCNIQAGSFEGSHEYARCTFVVEVKNLSHLDQVTKAIRRLGGISEVERAMHAAEPELPPEEGDAS